MSPRSERSEEVADSACAGHNGEWGNTKERVVSTYAQDSGKAHWAGSQHSAQHALFAKEKYLNSAVQTGHLWV